VGTLIIHGLLILLAGSIAWVHHVQKRSAEFTVSTHSLKLERRQLQMPERLERVRQTRQRPRIVSRRASVSAPSFMVPETDAPGKLSTQKFTIPFSGSTRDFGALSRGVSLGLPKIKFLGVRGEGEKVIFILEASDAMFTEETGGKMVGEHIRTQLTEVLSELPVAVLFNVMLHDGKDVFPFRSKLVPASAENRKAMEDWLAEYFSKASSLDPETARRDIGLHYETAIGDEARGWLRALQFSFEQRPDLLFIVGRDWGRHSISREKGKRLLDFSLWEILGGSGAFSISGSEVLRDDRKLRNDLLRDAVDAIVDEEKKKKFREDPIRFIHDLVDYIQYSEKQILDHTDAMYQVNYVPVHLAPPRVHFVRLVSEENEGVSDSSTKKMRKLARSYSGEFAFFNGSDLSRWDRAKSPDEEVSALHSSEASDTFKRSKFEFFNLNAKGSRVAFILDVSEKMFSPENGGTNTVAFLKDQLAHIVKRLDPRTGVNVIVCDSSRVSLFRPKMTPLTETAGLKEWLSGFTCDNSQTAAPPERAFYKSETVYNTAIGSDIKGLPLALQAALEQRADLILLVSADLGRVPVNPEKARRLLNFSIWETLGSPRSAGSVGESDEETDGEPLVEGGGDSGEPERPRPTHSTSYDSASGGGMLRLLEDDRKQRKALIRQALLRIAEELKARKKSGLPLGFVHDIFDYIEYTPDQIRAHFSVVNAANYPLENDERVLPVMHFVRLTEGETRKNRAIISDYRELLKTYGGELLLFRGANSEKKIRKRNRPLNLCP